MSDYQEIEAALFATLKCLFSVKSCVELMIEPPWFDPNGFPNFRKNFWEWCEDAAKAGKLLETLVDPIRQHIPANICGEPFGAEPSALELIIALADECGRLAERHQNDREKFPPPDPKLKEPRPIPKKPPVKRILSNRTTPERQRYLRAIVGCGRIEDWTPYRATAITELRVACRSIVPSDRPKKSQKLEPTSLDKSRWKFAKPLRQTKPRATLWKDIASMWDEKWKDGCDEGMMKQSCHRAKNVTNRNT